MSKKDAVKLDPRVRRTRKMLQQAMSELMAERTFPEIDVQDIAERAELNRATFYKHFPDKYELLNVIIRENFQTKLESRLAEPSALTETSLNVLLQMVFEGCNDFRGTCQAVHVLNDRGVMMQQLQVQVYQVLVNWLQHDSLRAKLGRNSPEMIALPVSWMICGSMMEIVRESSKTPKPELVRQLGVSVRAALGEYLGGN